MAKTTKGFVRKAMASLVLVFCILVAAVLVSFFFLFQNSSQDSEADCYVGVAFCGNTTSEAKLLIDRVKYYTNLLVIQSGPVSKNETATNEICDYAVKAGLKLIVYFGDLNYRVLTNETLWRIDWVNSAGKRWNSSLLGVYYYDEPGGLYLDTDWRQFPWTFVNATYDSTAYRFINGFKRDRGTVLLKNNSIPIFVSDYGLYWFDYLSGYDVVLAQAGWNHSFPQDIALLRGAANIQGKDWGVMITWKYTESPYLASAEEIYNQMVNAYKAGAKYVVVFNYPQLVPNGYGVMKDEHFESLERFWTEVVKDSSIRCGSLKAEAALVLPGNYGWGLRHPEDRIWGWWGPDEKSPGIWNLSRSLLSQYDLRLDIVYDDPFYSIEKNYTYVYYWNQTSFSP